MVLSWMDFVFAVFVCNCLLIPCATADSQGDALIALKLSLKALPGQLSDWYPYLVDPCGWSNVKCDSSNNVISLTLSSMGFSGTLSPKIGMLKTLTTLSLQGNGITGKIPDEIGNLSSLTNLNVENNRLTGVIPSSLGNLKSLTYLMLSHNSLTGTIPESLTDLNNLVSVDLASNKLSGQIPEQLFHVSTYNFTENKLSCSEDPDHLCASDSVSAGFSNKQKKGVTVGVVSGLASMIFIGGLLFFMFRCRICYKHEVFVDVEGEVDSKVVFGQVKRFSYRELQIATDNFSEKNVVGKGGFGKVYKGFLPDNTEVAVKRLTNFEMPAMDTTFLSEVGIISVAVHKNILRLIGFCTTPTERLLVYPFMKNLSVAYHLRELKPGEPVLDWPRRKEIALGTACGLEYLHDQCSPKIIHRDVKAANVLLNEEFKAVLGDFGLAKLVDVRKTNEKTQVRGTMGHIAPEYLSNGKFSEKTDVFGYGIMLLELVTGQHSIDLGADDILLLDHVKKLEREKKLEAIVDKNLSSYDIGEVEKMIKVALLCAQPFPEQRPAMSEVIQLLEGEGLGGRWKDCQLDEVSLRQKFNRHQTRFNSFQDSICNLEAIELSGGR